jgi:hypothetical protein
MSIDTSDVSLQQQQTQQNLGQNIWPVVMDTTNWVPGQEYEIPVIPFDHIWLPTTYDPALGINQAMAQLFKRGLGGNWSNGQLYPLGTEELNSPAAWPYVAYNPFDIVDVSDVSSNPRCCAPIFGLRFNSASAPYTIWSLSRGETLLNLSTGGYDYVPWGSFDAMRSASGIVTRMWAKLFRAAVYLPGIVPNAQNPMANSRTVFMTSLGFGQQTSGYVMADMNTGLDSNSNKVAADDYQVNVSGGGYTTTQLNTLQRLALAQQNQATGIPLATKITQDLSRIKS